MINVQCCSNSTTLVGGFTFPEGVTRSASGRYEDAHIYFSYTNCIYLHFDRRCGGNLGPYTGVHTCNIADSQGNNHSINIGFYNDSASKCNLSVSN